MKKLLLTLGAVASVAAPVAAVVACGSNDDGVAQFKQDTTTPGLALPAGAKNGSNIQDAFKNHLTFAELFSRGLKTITGDFAALETAAKSKGHEINIAGSAADRETAIDGLVKAVDTFNVKTPTLPASTEFTPASKVEKDLFAAYYGKKIKAVLFYQDKLDANENKKGEAFVVLKGKVPAEWTTADKDWVEMRDDAKGFDDINQGHAISADNFGIRFDIVA